MAEPDKGAPVVPAEVKRQRALCAVRMRPIHPSWLAIGSPDEHKPTAPAD